MSVKPKAPAIKAPPQSRILLIDDHPVVRAGVRHAIEKVPDLTVSGELDNADDAVKAIRELTPDLVVLDISLAESHGFDLVKHIKASFPEMPVLILSMHDEAVYAPRALRAGARGYIMKQEPPARLIAAIRQVLGGGVYVSEAETKRMLRTMSTVQTEKLSVPSEILSDRELQIFELLGQGYGSREIANTLRVSLKTVNSHRENIKTKLNLSTGQELIRQAIQSAQLRAARTS